MVISERLAQVRKNTGLTQTEFAKKMGISRRAFVNYESGEREIPSSLAVKLDEVLAVNPRWLLTGEGAQTSDHTGQIIEDAVIAVRTFVVMKKLKITPEEEAKLVALLAEYFEQGGEKSMPLVKKMLEMGT